MSHIHQLVIEAQHLSMGYGKQAVIQDFSAQIYSGEFVAILGPNGAGKSTLLKTLLGSLSPFSGELKVLNHDPHQDCVGIGYMPQHLMQPELAHLNAWTLMSAVAQAHQWGLPHLSKKQHEEIQMALEQVEALEFAHKAFGDCSGGQQRRIMLAQALLGQPKVLLLDEPLANLDFRQQEKFIEILTRLTREKHVTILLTTHDINPLINVMTRVLYLAKGRGLLGDLKSVLNSEKLSELYQIPMEVIRYQDRYFVVQNEADQSRGAE